MGNTHCRKKICLQKWEERRWKDLENIQASEQNVLTFIRTCPRTNKNIWLTRFIEGGRRAKFGRGEAGVERGREGWAGEVAGGGIVTEDAARG